MASLLKDSGLTWYQIAWALLPFGLVGVGGVLGGACGLAAAAVNLKVMQGARASVQKYLLCFAISGAAAAAWFVLATIVFAAMG